MKSRTSHNWKFLDKPVEQVQLDECETCGLVRSVRTYKTGLIRKYRRKGAIHWLTWAPKCKR